MDVLKLVARLVVVLGLLGGLSSDVLSQDQRVGVAKLWPTTEKMVQAFKALEPSKGPRDLIKAIALTSDVIGQHRFKARADQKKVTGVPEPGHPASEAEFNRIAANGILNDVATCYFIRGRAYRLQGNHTLAADDFRAGAALTKGRCWDPGPGRTGGYNRVGIFWSPAEECGYQLEDMVDKKEIKQTAGQPSNGK